MDKAVSAARAAFKSNAPWRTMDASQRATLMHKVIIMLTEANITTGLTVLYASLGMTVFQ